MAITSSAKKVIRASEKKRIFNVRQRDAIYKTTKAFLKLTAAKKTSEAQKLLPAAYKAIDKAMKRGVLKKNTAARKKSRLAHELARIGK